MVGARSTSFDLDTADERGRALPDCTQPREAWDHSNGFTCNCKRRVAIILVAKTIQHRLVVKLLRAHDGCLGVRRR